MLALHQSQASMTEGTEMSEAVHRAMFAQAHMHHACAAGFITVATGESWDDTKTDLDQ